MDYSLIKLAQEIWKHAKTAENPKVAIMLDTAANILEDVATMRPEDLIVGHQVGLALENAREVQKILRSRKV